MPPTSPRRALVVIVATLVAAGGIAVAGFFIDPMGYGFFAVITHFVLMAWVSAVIGPGVQIPDHAWLRVRSWELPLQRVLGVRVFGEALEAVGWNRVLAGERVFDGTRSGLGELDQHTRRSEIGHGLCLLVTVGLAIVFLVVRAWAGVGWLVGLAIPLHLYPMLLQRHLRSRVHMLTSGRAGG